MGLMKLSGDLYDYVEDTKIAAMGVESMDTNQVAPNNLADKQPQQVDSAVKPIQAALKQPAPNVPAAPIPAPEQDIYMPNQKSLPPLPPNTRYASYEGSNMSRLKNLLNKVAMTQEDLDSDYSEFPQGELTEEELFPAMEGDPSLHNYTPPSDYSNYMSARVPVQQDSYDIGDYADLPQQEYSEYMNDSMGYSPFSQGDYMTMGYDPYQAYANYEQMYASPNSGGGEYQDIQTQAAEPQVDPAQQAYQQSYDEVYSYLVQMGYSPEEAAAAVPSLLQQVNVSAPQQQKQASYREYTNQPRVMTKTASITFNSRANELKASYVEAGYSPYQAQQMSMEVVIPEAEKYASLAGRVIGGGVGAVTGGLGAHSRYDKGEDTSALLAGALLGGGLGAFAGGRVPSYLGKNIAAPEVIKDLEAANRAIFKKQLKNARELDLIGGSKRPTDFKELLYGAKQRILTEPKALHKHPSSRSVAEQAKVDKYNQAVADLEKQLQLGEGATVTSNLSTITKLKNTSDPVALQQALQPFRAQAGAAARASDAKALLAGTATAAIPGYYIDSGLRRTGGDNVVDGSFDTVSSGIDSLGNALSAGGSRAADLVRENPELAAALAAGAIATPFAVDYATQQTQSKKKGGRSKKAQLEHNLEKVAARQLAKVLGGAAIGAGTQAIGEAGLSTGLGRETDLAPAILRGAILGAGAGALGLAPTLGLGAIGLGTGLVGAGMDANRTVKRNAPKETRSNIFARAFGFGKGGLMDKYRAYNSIENRRARRIESLTKQVAEKERVDKEYARADKARADFEKQEDSLLARLGIFPDADPANESGVVDYIQNNPGTAALIGAGTAAGLYGLYNLANSGSKANELKELQKEQLSKGLY